MKNVRIGIVVILSVVFLGRILGGAGLNKDNAETIALNYYGVLKHQLDKGVDQKQLIAIVDSVLEFDNLDSEVVDFLNAKIKKEYGEAWPIDTNPFPAHNLYKSWNTLAPHPYQEEIYKADSEMTISLTDSYMNCGYAHPFEGVVTSGFGWRHNKQHNGIDIDLVRGDTVKNVFRGVVRFAKWTSGYGRTVIIRHHNGLETIYAHLYKILVKPGQYVDPGDFIGRGGNSGASRGSHLHFETRYKGKPINPEALIDFKNYSLLSDSLAIRKTRYGFVAFQPGTLFHKIKGGDYLYKIAMNYGVSVKDICNWNGIKRNHMLVAGREIKVSE